MPAIASITDPAFRAARMLKLMRDNNISDSAAHLLLILRAAGADSLTMTSASKTMGTSSGSITGLADNLESRGLIQRRPSATDRRAIWLDLTPDGNALLDEILAEQAAGPAPSIKVPV